MFFLLFTSFWVFHISVSRWFLIRVWVTASLFKSPGLSSVFLPISIVLQFGWSPLVLLFRNPPVPLTILWLLYPEYQSQFNVPYLFFQFPCKMLIFLFIFFHFYSVVSRDSKVHNSPSSLFFCFCWLIVGLVIWPRLGDPFVSQHPRRVCASHSSWRILGCEYHHHHHHVALVARISLTLSRHSSLSFIALGRSSGQHPVSSHSCSMYVRTGRPAFARPCVGVHKSTSLMSSSLLLQQCPACLVRLTWIVFVIGGRWPYS